MHIYQTPPLKKALQLLSINNLPTADLSAASMKHFFGCGAERDPGGIAGLEIHGSYGLLRSLAVAPEFQAKGCGKALVDRIEVYAKDRGLKRLYLLTNTAENYFAKRGYVRVERAHVPEPIRRTSEFSEILGEWRGET